MVGLGNWENPWENRHGPYILYYFYGGLGNWEY